MRAPHRFWTRTFVIGGLILFGIGLFFIANRQKLFNRNFEVYAEFDRLNRLQRGAKVSVSGMDAGEVLETEVPNRPDGRFRLKLRIQQTLHAFVRTDSVATIKTMGLAGNSFVDIQKGTPSAPESPTGSTISSREPLDIADLMQQGSELLKTTQTSIEHLRTSADRTLQSINSAAHHTDQTIVALRPGLQEMVASARKTSEDMREIVAQARRGQGMVGKLLSDQQLAADLDQIVNNIRQSALNLNNASGGMNETVIDLKRRDLAGRAEAVLENSRQITQQLNQAVSTVTSGPPGDENAPANLRDTIASARTSATNLAAATEALKDNFFLRGFFKRRGYFNLNQMTPAQYRSSKFLKKDAHERVWLSKNELFSSGPDDEEELTRGGQQQIDSAMSAFIPYLPNSPMVVEGYATQTSPSEKFMRAKQRASLVKTYLNKRFGLKPDMVAVMPMSDSMPPSVGKSVWDGVSLVLIR